MAAAEVADIYWGRMAAHETRTKTDQWPPTMAISTATTIAAANAFGQRQRLGSAVSVTTNRPQNVGVGGPFLHGIINKKKEVPKHV